MDKTDDFKIEIGKRIEYIMNEKGMTRAEFAKFINTTVQQLSKVIRGEMGFSYKKLKEVSDITKFPLSFIVDGNTYYSINEILEKQLLEAEKTAKELYDTLAAINLVLKIK